jgi:hypothetical protein
LIIKNKKDKPENKKNTGYGDPTPVIINGATITLKATPNQLVDVAGGTHLGGII